MNPQLKSILGKYRKQERDTMELRKLKQRVMEHKNPDPKIIKMIDDEIDNLNKGQLTP